MIKHANITRPSIRLGILILMLLVHMSSFLYAEETSSPEYEFEIIRDWLTMQDGMRLAVSYFQPIVQNGEKLPALLELLPYRKDDLFYLRDYPVYAYFARRGYVMVKVDIRGTGASEGEVPPREYSEIELEDAVEIIDQLSKAPWCNGNVGMWGISWGGFNAIQVAMRRPPALKAILAGCASDDLFYDDVHYIDGAYHVDQYELRIDTKHALPRWPDYTLDEAYFEDRFNAYPWFLTYLKQQQDGPFWRKNSLRWDYQAIQIPVYMFGGLLDGYKDSIPRMLENMQVPLKADMGPYNHAWPDTGVPGPNFEWRHELTRWWDHWLKGRDTGIMDEPRFSIFVREGHPPDPLLKMTPGHRRYEEWPIKRTQWIQLFPSENGLLQPDPQNRTTNHLKYVPSSGVALGYWWGEPTGDMRPEDATSLVYDSNILDKKTEIIGFPKVKLQVSTDAELAHWAVRLEDVHPDGRVSLVTGAVFNGSHFRSRLNPEYLIPEKIYDLEFPMHFTTWTFQPGHRIRLAVSNALFPMIWPTPYSMTTQLYLGETTTCLELPVIPFRKQPQPQYLPPEPREKRPDARSLESKGWPFIYRVNYDIYTATTTVEWEGESEMEISGDHWFISDRTTYRTQDTNPANSSFFGKAIRRITRQDRSVELQTLITVRSDKKNFYVDFTRKILENQVLIREKTWKETIPRRFQ